ncbi:MAG TPA: EAL domain-containing protein [Marinobacter sp.]|nr:EAL domain-containing protein [Marinobacter sp.]
MSQALHYYRHNLVLFLLSTACLCTGLIGITAFVFPALPVPEALRLSWMASLGLILAGLALAIWLSRLSGRSALLEQLSHQATHDTLTGLGNRALFEERLRHHFALARRQDRLIAVLFVDLDEFKPINDTLGHKVGDSLLITVARVLENCIRPTDTVARFGGDEFVVLLPDLDSPRQAEDVARRIVEKIALPHQVGEHELYLSASVGISLLDNHQDVPEKLIQQADMAMYKAKRQGRDTFHVYSHDLDTKLSRRVTLRNDLQEAIQTGQFVLHYQPQVDQHGRLCGLEALVRWRHPEKGLVYPESFIELAEQTGQVVQLGKWILHQACADAVELGSLGLLYGRVAVNLSPLQFHRPGFLKLLTKTLVKTGLRADCLELELTESLLMRDREGAFEILQTIQKMGIATAIDDFGTGFSSFRYLRDLPTNSIKIDKSFVENVVTSRKDAAVCKGVITLARELGLTVVAEGVEEEAQFDILRAWGCHAFQGFYFARPMPLGDLIKWIEKRSQTSACTATF